ncbi:MAG: dTDP-glucose 4,6-dehydratase [Desulfurivibrionaceae bacterium]
MENQFPHSPVLVTGGAGFIGANFVHHWLRGQGAPLINLDNLTYAGNPENLAGLEDNPDHIFVQGDIGDRELVADLLHRYKPRAIVNFAAESHVDRSIHGPDAFIRTNVVGTFHLLEEARAYWSELPEEEKEDFRFLQVSTDEVYGSLKREEPPFTEKSCYSPNSPYSASKASADHLVRAAWKTYGLPVLTSNCSNNYGPFQFPEKLIPLIIRNARRGERIPVYGDGGNIRDWLYVTDHCQALCCVLSRGRPGEVYNIGGNQEKTNLEIIHTVCSILDELLPDSPYKPHESLISHVQDRPGHDRRYAIDSGKISRELGWQPEESFESGIRKTVVWYLENRDWVEKVSSGEYQDWLTKNYRKR